MHLVKTQSHSLDEAAAAVDLDQTPGDVVFLSFSDSDLSGVASAWSELASKLTLRIANLNALAHPYSVDLYVEKVCARARLVLVRLLGGMDYWRYGVEELAAAARTQGFMLAVIPGDRFDDSRLTQASTLSVEKLRLLWRYFEAGGRSNFSAGAQCLRHWLGEGEPAPEPAPIAPFVRYERACLRQSAEEARALIIFYRSLLMADDVAPIDALAAALQARGAAVTSVALTSLKDASALGPLSECLRQGRFDIILDATAFSARGETGGPLEAADAPVLQVVLSTASTMAWTQSARGLGPADLAMHVALPEIDGRILSRAISFKEPGERDAQTQFARATHRPLQDRIDYVADLAMNWARLRRKPARQRRLACIFSDYPAKGGRAGYAIGLDTPASAAVIAAALQGAGYHVPQTPQAAALIDHLSQGAREAVLSLADYVYEFTQLPAGFRAQVEAAWGAAGADDALENGMFCFRLWRSGNLIVAVQPDRGGAAGRKSGYHDLGAVPRHAYIAFYLWLRRVERIDALIHLGAHGTLEWLPGKAVALSRDCAPEIILGPLPVIYPFIVNNPGEAAQAKRRLSAVTLGHLTPPLTPAGAHGASQALEGLFDEYAEAQALDPRRARAIAALIMDKARSSGLLGECAAEADEPEAALAKLDACLCDLKEMRIGDGLHIYGQDPPPAPGEPKQDEIFAGCGANEIAGLLRALDGRFAPPGPAGAPSLGRLDVLPTGRNLYAMDPRAVPTRNAYDIGKRRAQEVLARYAQDHGDWPKRIVLDLWGSATMRTGGDDIGQAFALLGVRPVWDHASSRVNGFEILPLAALGRPRVDVTLRISGLFRDVFPQQIALIGAAIQAVAALDESADDNPLAQGGPVQRIFGAEPGRYGVGLSRTLAQGDWAQRDELAAAYLDATSRSYDQGADGVEARAAFAKSVAQADAFVHTQDMAGQDVLDSDAFAEHEGGFAAAAAMQGASPALYHIDAADPGRDIVRPLAQEIARALRGRAVNPRWIAGQMRHGHRGAMEIAEGLDNLFAYAALTHAVESRQFDMIFDATLGDDAVRAFLLGANRLAAQGMAAKFEEAARRGFWRSRRNSSAQILAGVAEFAA